MAGEVVVSVSAELIVACVALLTAGGGAVRWLVHRGDRAVAKVEAKMAKLESRYATLRIAFQLVANELAKHDAENPVLRRAQMALLRDYGEPVVDAEFDDLLEKIK